MPGQTRTYMAAASWATMLLILFTGAWLTCDGPSCPTHSFDAGILEWFSTIRSPGLDRFFLIATWAGSIAVLLPLTIGGAMLLVAHRRTREALFLSLAVTGATALTILAKIVIARPRPDLFPTCCPIPASPSFPSSHTAQMVAFALAALWVVKGRIRPACYQAAVFSGIFLVLLVGVSRMYLQVHYFSDILASILATSLWVAGLAIVILGGSGNSSDKGNA